MKSTKHTRHFVVNRTWSLLLIIVEMASRANCRVLIANPPSGFMPCLLDTIPTTNTMISSLYFHESKTIFAFIMSGECWSTCSQVTYLNILEVGTFARLVNHCHDIYDTMLGAPVTQEKTYANLIALYDWK